MVRKCEPTVSVSGGGRTLAGRVLILALALFALMTATANAELITKVNGDRELLGKSGEVLREWTWREWEAWTREVAAENEAMRSADTEAVRQMMNLGETGAGTVSPSETQAATQVVTRARGEGVTIAEDVASDLTEGAEASGGLAPALGASVVGGVLLGPAAFKLGIDIGNGLDELFGLPTLGEQDEEDGSELAVKGCNLTNEEPLLGGVDSVRQPAGEYVSCGGSIALAKRQSKVPVAPKQAECEGGIYGPFDTALLPPDTLSYWTPDTRCLAGGAKQETLIARTTGECDLTDAAVKWLDADETPKCKPVGVPGLAPLPVAIQNQNVEAGIPPEPTYRPAPLPPLPGSLISAGRGEATAKKFAEHPDTRNFIETEGGKTPKELVEEEEAEELVQIPAPYAQEKASQYATSLASIGLGTVTITEVSDTNEDPSAGPEGVAFVDPNVGSRVKPGTDVRVGENPDDVAPPEAPGGIGPPNLPGLNFPHLGILCKNFPFGVPCWLVSEFALWSASGSAPELGIENFEVMGHEIHGSQFKLAPLEPIVVRVRPFILLFSLISIIVMFYKWSTGKAAGDSAHSNDEDQ